MPGRIMIVSGPSSGGKSTLVKTIRGNFYDPLCLYSTDVLTDGDFIPLRHTQSEGVAADTEKFYRGFHRSIAAFADAGNDMIVEMVFECPHLADDLASVLTNYRTLWIWASASEETRRQREVARGDRREGTTDLHVKARDYRIWNLEIDTAESEAENLLKIINAWSTLGSA
ncbi:phosphotransferase-like protein [Methylobacterium fujisawaense]